MTMAEKQWQMQQMGGYTTVQPPAKKRVVVTVKNLPPPKLPHPPMDMQRLGGYLVERQTPQGERVFQPLPDLGEYMANGGLRRIGASYYEGATGYYIALRDGTFKDFTNFTGQIEAKEVELSASGERTERYLVSLKSEGCSYYLRIPTEDWPSLMDYIERFAPQCQIFGDEVPNHRERFKRLAGFWLKGNFPSKMVAAFWGWGPLQANQTRMFCHGGRADCTSSKVLPPIVQQNHLAQIVQAGMGNILAAGPLNVTAPLMLYALASYADAIFTDAGFPLTHCMMLIGESGFLKSSFAKEIFSPFVPYPKRTYTVRSTEASMNVLHEQAFDDTLVVDDFNLEGSPAEVRQKMRNIRGLIRGYSDKTPRAKYGGADKIKQYALRGGCIFTAETQMTGQLKSGELRYLKICLHAPLDKTKIAILHDNPTIVPQFYAVFIRFLEAHYTELVAYTKAQFPCRRTTLDIPEPRMKDAVIHLTLTADFLLKLVNSSSSYDGKTAFIWHQNVSSILYQLGYQQSIDAQIGEPYLRYLAEVWNLIGTGKLKIAPTLQAYIAEISTCIGYRENDLLIVKKDETYKAVMDAFYARNEGLPIGVDEISKKLKEAGLTKCDRDSCLLKASSKIPGRPRMLAFVISACNKKLEGEK